MPRRSASVPFAVWAKTPLIACATPAPGALMPIQPLFWKRANGPAATETWPSMTPLLTTRVPTAVGPVWMAKAPGAAASTPVLISEPNRPFICTAALPAPVALIDPLLVTTPYWPAATPTLLAAVARMVPRLTTSSPFTAEIAAPPGVLVVSVPVLVIGV